MSSISVMSISGQRRWWVRKKMGGLMAFDPIHFCVGARGRPAGPLMFSSDLFAHSWRTPLYPPELTHFSTLNTLGVWDVY